MTERCKICGTVKYGGWAGDWCKSCGRDTASVHSQPREYRKVYAPSLDAMILDFAEDAIVPATPGVSTWAVAKYEPLPFFMDPDQIRALTPEVDWDKRVGDRIRWFLEWGRK